MNAFWLVWCNDGAAPRVKHHNVESANSEAKRLARANPGRQFVVLESLGHYEVDDIKFTTHEVDLPF